jgi:hypothetical protein
MFDDFVLLLAALFLICTLICTPMVGFALWADYASCNNQLAGLKVEGYWKAFGGCFGKTTDGRFVPLDLYRGMESLKLDSNK